MPVQLDAESLAEVRKILDFHVPALKVWVFGSRATETAKRFSDLDIALEGDAPIAYETISKLKHAFTESDLPMRVDVVDWNSLDEEFKQAIDVQRIPLFDEAAVQ